MASFPQPFISSTSHWQGTNRGPNSLYNHNRDARPEPEADILIIGGGMMGASLSYFLTRKGADGDGKRIVLIEAKDVASGATGRNGGHVGPATFESYHRLISPIPVGGGLTSHEAVHVVQAERDNLELIAEIVKEEGIAEKVDFWKGYLCEVHETQEDTDLRRAQNRSWLAARKDYGLNGTGDTEFIDDVAEARRISRFKEATSVHMRPGGSVHSHKLCTELIRLALDSPHSDYQLYSWTPASSIVPPTQEKGHWTVKTAKGDIRARRVVLCVNAYTKDFFPKDDLLHSHIKPRRSQVALITPPETYSGSKALKHSYNMRDEGYLMQTPMGGIVLGGGLDVLVREGKLDPGVSDSLDDSQTIQQWDEYLAKYCPSVFEGWGPEGKGEGLTRVWSGILSSVKDKLPVVGPVPGKEGLFIAAGFHGHGMSRIFSTGKALSSILQTGVWSAELLPRSFELTTERLEKSRDALHLKVESSSFSCEYAEKALESQSREKRESKKLFSSCIIA